MVAKTFSGWARVTQNVHFAAIGAQSGCADIIFIHGITGDPIATWTSAGSTEPEGSFWPKWLAIDFPHLNFYTLGYPASIFAQWAKKEMSLYERAKSTLELLAGFGFGSRPLVFICHSLGGLLAKQLLRTAKESPDQGWQLIAGSCTGILFLATPHTGSELANLLKTFSGSFSSPHVDKLVADSSDLDELNASFRSFCHQHTLDVSVYYEMYKTYKLAIVVDKVRADPGVNGVMPIGIETDHLNICKPSSRHSLVYISIHRKLRALFPVQIFSEATTFEPDDLHDVNSTDRRDLHTKLSAAKREHEYSFANDSQNRFAREFVRMGLMTATSQVHRNLLADVEQRFQSLVFHPLICADADHATVSTAVQAQVIDPLAQKYADHAASAKTIMNALYFLTERCHVRWDKP